MLTLANKPTNRADNYESIKSPPTFSTIIKRLLHHRMKKHTEMKDTLLPINLSFAANTPQRHAANNPSN